MKLSGRFYSCHALCMMQEHNLADTIFRVCAEGGMTFRNLIKTPVQVFTQMY